MKVYVVYYYHEDRFDGLYGSYKTEAAAVRAAELLEDKGFRVMIQVMRVG